MRSSDPARRKDRLKAANFVCGSLFAAGSALIVRSLTMFDGDDQYALFLSLLAGLATSVGGIIAVMKKPDQKMLAFLLGTAIGVMATLSLVELYVKNLMQNGFVEVTVAMCIGAVVYMVLEPLLPKTEALEAKVEKQGSGGDDVPTRMSKARLMRLGILMAITMTLHNLPEGFAVAFSSFTGIGPVMAAAIGVHNVPEASIRSSNFRPLHKKLFWLFVGYHSRRPGLCGDRKPSICTDAGHCIGFVGACWGVHRAFFHQALPDAEAAALSACGNRRHDDRRMHHRAVS